MRRVVLLAILAIALAARAAGQAAPAADPRLGIPLAEPAPAILADVLVRSILVGPRYEVAAFIVRDPGSMGCILWPQRNLVFAATFSGIVPPNTVALVHSHPIGAPPSKRDIDAARLQNLPHYVVNMTHIWVIDPDGRVTTLVRGRLWLTELDDRPGVCREAAPSLSASR